MAAAPARPRPRIAVFGSLNMDLVAYVPHHPQPGETLTASRFDASPGGKGANQAVACAKLSRAAPPPPPPPSSSSSSPSPSPSSPSPSPPPAADVAMFGAVGSDGYGAALRASLASFGVDTRGVCVRPEAKTGLAVVVVDEPSGQNRIILSPEANHALRPADAAAAVSGPPPDLLVMQLEIPLDTVLAALDAARAARVPVLLNPAPARALPADAYRGLAHLVVNETEAAMLSGCAASDLDHLAGLRRVGALFLQRGVAHVVVTLGARGLYYATASGRSALVPAVDTHVVDTTAAGDTFVGCYALAAVAAGPDDLDMDAAVRAANRAAAMTVSRRGAQISIPWKDELE